MEPTATVSDYELLFMKLHHVQSTSNVRVIIRVQGFGGQVSMLHLG